MSMKPILSCQLLKSPDRWSVYRRLQELEIPCECAVNQPLSVEIHTVMAALQFRSVVQQFTATRRELIHWLDDCWQSSSYEK